MITITNSIMIISSYKTVKLLYTLPLIVTYIYAAIIMPVVYIDSQNPDYVSKRENVSY